MNVRLAVQILSSSVANTQRQYGPAEAAGTATYCDMIDKFFDCVNVRNQSGSKKKLKPFLKSFESLDDERLTWLIEVFLKYFTDWKDSVDNRKGNFSAKDREAMFISSQTYEGLRITFFSMVEVIKYLLLKCGINYVLTERFCQDPLENYFGRQRAIGGRKDNHTLRDFGYNDNAIKNTQATRSICGNVTSRQHGFSSINKIDSTSVPCRKRKR